ncbi:PTS transporter subunit EIIC, partial [Escherichia coli]|uniref:PTS transporter subunit EIIC n=1 Tax=Escherichia coli TaxID=562 RepID=UPI001649C0E4
PNLPLTFAIAVPLALTNNDAVSALAAVVVYGILSKTIAVVAPLVLHLSAHEIASKHLVYTGVPVRIISGALAASTLNRFHSIKLPAHTSFFTCTSFLPT